MNRINFIKTFAASIGGLLAMPKIVERPEQKEEPKKQEELQLWGTYPNPILKKNDEPTKLRRRKD